MEFPLSVAEQDRFVWSDLEIFDDRNEKVGATLAALAEVVGTTFPAKHPLHELVELDSRLHENNTLNWAVRHVFVHLFRV